MLCCLRSTGWLSDSRSKLSKVTTDNDRTPADSAESGEQNAPPTPQGSIPVKPLPRAPTNPAKLDQVKAERDKLRGQLMRTAADFDNFRKRTKRDLDDVRQRGKDDLIRDLLPVFDNLERAVQSGTVSSEVSSVLEGVAWCSSCSKTRSSVSVPNRGTQGLELQELGVLGYTPLRRAK